MEKKAEKTKKIDKQDVDVSSVLKEHCTEATMAGFVECIEHFLENAQVGESCSFTLQKEK